MSIQSFELSKFNAKVLTNRSKVTRALKDYNIYYSNFMKFDPRCLFLSSLRRRKVELLMSVEVTHQCEHSANTRPRISERVNFSQLFQNNLFQFLCLNSPFHDPCIFNHKWLRRPIFNFPLEDRYNSTVYITKTFEKIE